MRLPRKSVRFRSRSCLGNKLEVQDHEYQENEKNTDGTQNNTLLVHPAIDQGHRARLMINIALTA